MYRDIPSDWVQLAHVDEAGPYEVDESTIYRLPSGGFVLVTASGCSCWDGDYEVGEEFGSLDELVSMVLNREGFLYNPSLKGAEELVEQARTALLIGD